METIRVQYYTPKGNKERAIDAETIGQLAVHKGITTYGFSDFWTVTELSSGYAVGHFNAKHVAINFATRVDDMFDFARLQSDMEYRREVTPKLIAMLFHPASVYVDPTRDIRKQLFYASWDDIETFRKEYGRR